MFDESNHYGLLLWTDKIQHAIKFAKLFHGNQMYGSMPYVEYHLLGVARLAQDFSIANDVGLEDVLLVSILHDALEDTIATYEQLVAFYGEKVANSVYRLTKRKDETYSEYLKGIVDSSSLIHLVKTADNMFNQNESIKNNNQARFKKYCDSLKFLMG